MALVLIVDQSPRDALVARDLLVTGGVFQVLVAPTAERGLGILRDHEVDILVVHQTLPDSSGIDCLRAAVEAGFQGAAIVTADTLDRDVAAQAVRLGAAHYVVKAPAWPAPLPGLLVRALERARLLRQNRELAQRTQALEEKLAALERERSAVIPRDPVTELYRPWYFDECAAREAARARRLGHALTILEVQVARLSRLQAVHGDEEVEGWLRLAAGSLTSAIRTTDVAAHFGRGHFRVLLTDCGQAGAEVVARRLRHNLAELKRRNYVPHELDCLIAVRPAGEPGQPETRRGVAVDSEQGARKIA